MIDRRESFTHRAACATSGPLRKNTTATVIIGVPMFDSAGKIIGHFACMDGKPMRQDLPHLALFKIFSVRAAAEFERMLLRQKLEGVQGSDIGIALEDVVSNEGAVRALVIPAAA